MSISEDRNKTYLELEIAMFSNAPNANSDALMNEFIDEIVENKNYYLALPLYADVYGLVGASNDEMVHKLDEEENLDFRSQIVGGFVDFNATPNDKGEYWLYGTVRIPKKDKRIAESIKNRYKNDNLFFSFEIAYQSYLYKDGITYLNKSDTNKLFAMAIVDNPAYVDSRALSLVATRNNTIPESEEDELEKEKKLTAEETSEKETTVDTELSAENIESSVETEQDQTTKAEDSDIKEESKDVTAEEEQEVVDTEKETVAEQEPDTEAPTEEKVTAESEDISVANYEEKIKKLQKDLETAAQDIEKTRHELWEKEHAIYEMEQAAEKDSIKEMFAASKIEVDADTEALIQTLNYKGLFISLSEKYKTLVNGFAVSPGGTASASKKTKYDKSWAYNQSEDK